MPDLLVVADGQDALAGAFAVRCRDAGRDVAHWSFREAALRFCIKRNSSVRVEPSVPVLLRPPPPLSQGASREDFFHHAEICSFVWAAAALTDAEVVNRPNAWGFSGRVAGSSEVTRRRAGIRGVEMATEAFSSHCPEVDDRWWLERQADRELMPWSVSLDERGPYRSGRVEPGAQAVVVAVVGDTACVVDDSPSGVDLRDRSREVCAALGLTFALLTWRWDPGRGHAELARVAHPSLADLGSAWPLVADALEARLRS